jgi:HAD superfamily hydrolase (TIGR01450 family)
LAERVLAAEGSPGNVVLDLDGCLYVADVAVDGARESLERLRYNGFTILFATNNSTKSTEVVADRIQSITGFEVAPESVITSAAAAATMLTPQDHPVLPIGEAGLVGTLVEAGVAVTEDPREARSVIVGLDRAITYDRIRRAAQAVLLGARFIGTNPDATFPTSSVPTPGAGALIAAVERASGTAPEFAGKPYEPMRRAVAAVLAPGPTWVVGDRAETDIAFGKLGGWRTVLVLTGLTADIGEVPSELRPDHVLASVAGLPGIIGV